ncbi:hypothetical protein BDQ17DRAFT_1378916 [Cyathus striatus]|nr:hypothetical protein BDQ17DRAFT_1378916 [Cyathus striatus]
MLDRAKKYSERQMAFENDLCAHCTNKGNPTLKQCSGCRQIKYCSKACQKIDWKRHKHEVIVFKKLRHLSKPLEDG